MFRMQLPCRFSTLHSFFSYFFIIFGSGYPQLLFEVLVNKHTIEIEVLVNKHIIES